ncbi:MAG: hypothetical protein KDC74_08055 [Flavobacteriaceae bacterium]|jgi:hypothetical protein|nr:hypothetical protein [Flavobacteriaceae bacterium]
MKGIVLCVLLCVSVQTTKAQPIFSENGYPEHFIAGTIIGGATSYFVYKKTDNKLKAWLIGTATATAVGFLKEAIDPKLLGGVKSNTDVLYTSLGGGLGASIVIPLKRKKRKKTPNIDTAFNGY